MHRFYNRALIVCVVLLATSLLLTYACARLSHTHVALLPPEASAFPVKMWATSDANIGGTSSSRLIPTTSSLRFEFKIDTKIDHPFAAAELWFGDRGGHPRLVDLSPYTTISFFARCSTTHTLAMAIPTFDPKISVRDDILTYRTMWTFFPCTESGNRVELDLTRLETPQWWYDLFRFDLLRHRYVLNQVPKIGFGTAQDVHPGTSTLVDISGITLNGRNYRYLAALAALLSLKWLAFIIWLFRAHARALATNIRAQLHSDKPLIEYQRLTIEPLRDREKADILQYIASNYANSGLDIETVAAKTATSRTKVNDVLKASFGYTFAGYLNKVRLTEAARLLSESATATISEIAYSVGYANIPYFNKLFKEAYGCTPKAFRNGYKPPDAS